MILEAPKKKRSLAPLAHRMKTKGSEGREKKQNLTRPI